MGFMIKLKTRDEDNEITLRGNDDGTVDFVKEVNTATGLQLQPYKFFSSIESAVERIFKVRVNNREATTLEQLLKNVKEEREELRKEFAGIKLWTVNKQ